MIHEIVPPLHSSVLHSLTPSIVSMRLTMESLPYEIYTFIRIFRLFGWSHMKKTPHVSKILYLFHKIYNTIVLISMVIFVSSAITVSLIDIVKDNKLFTFVDKLLGMMFYVQILCSSCSLYILSRKGQLQIEKCVKLKFTRKMVFWHILLLIPQLIVNLLDALKLWKDYGSKINTYCINYDANPNLSDMKNNVTKALNTTTTGISVDYVYNLSYCIYFLMSPVFETSTNLQFLTVPGYLFFRTYILVCEVSRYKDELRKDIVNQFGIEKLQSFRKKLGILSKKISSFNTSHKYLTACSIITGILSINSFLYIVFKMPGNSYDITVTLLYTPAVLINYSLLMYGPAMLHDSVSR